MRSELLGADLVKIARRGECADHMGKNGKKLWAKKKGPEGVLFKQTSPLFFL